MIYLDNCATTKMRKEVLDTMVTSLEEDFGNPSSLHRLGHSAEKGIKESRNIISNYLKVDEREIYFTSGGTESNNIAIQGIANSLRKKGNHIITSKIEHSSVVNVIKELEHKGFKVTYLDVDEYGKISLERLREAIGKDTILISLIHVNNEIGTIQDIKAIRSIMKEKSSDALLHLDGVQSFGKIDFSLKQLEVDTFSFSSHKIHGPKGIGGLYIRRDLNLSPIIFGGNQERGIRSGTENAPAIIAFAKAVDTMNKNKEAERKLVSALKQYTIDSLKESIDGIRINSPLSDSFSPYILSVSLRNTRGEVLLHFLEQKDIYISTSSACASIGSKKSEVLKAIDLTDIEIEGTIRICFSYDLDHKDIDVFVSELKDSVKEIRKITLR